jgi:hypothetical protein
MCVGNCKILKLNCPITISYIEGYNLSQKSYCINIAGVPENFEIIDVPIDDITLDEENPRIGYYKDNYSFVIDHFSQEQVKLGLKAYPDAYSRLKDNIEHNGSIIVEIWLIKKEEKYLCIDGNTRVLIYRDLRDEYPNKPEWQKIRAKVLLKERVDDRTVNFIRLMAHLRGVNEWQVYERARLLYILYHDKGYTEKELQTFTKLSLTNIRKWRDAYMTMNEQFLPKYSQNFSDALTKFSYFVEYYNPKIVNGMKRYGLNVQDFCEWVGNNEIKRGMEVRLLKDIFKNEKAAEVLATRGFDAAKNELMHVAPALGSKLFEHIDECIQGFKKMTVEEERGILSKKDPNKLKMINDLHKELDFFVKHKS